MKRCLKQEIIFLIFFVFKTIVSSFGFPFSSNLVAVFPLITSLKMCPLNYQCGGGVPFSYQFGGGVPFNYQSGSGVPFNYLCGGGVPFSY